MKTIHAAIVICGALLPLGNLGWAGASASAALRNQQPTEAQRLAKEQERERMAQQQSSAAGAPGPQGTLGPGSGQSKTTGGTRR